MAKHMFIDAEDSEFLQAVGKALSSKERIEILKLLYYKSLNINEISEALSLPASSTSVHIRILEEADLIYTENQPGIRGTMKLCSRKKDDVFIKLTGESSTTSKVESISMPIGNFTDCQVAPTCGMAGKDDYIIYEDNPTLFFVPNRTEAQLIWTSRGFFEYRFPKPDTKNTIESISIIAEMCSEAPNYREDWKSDICLWLNGVECGTWRCPGDFGDRRGRLTPNWWKTGNTQYGLLTKWTINNNGCYINNIMISDTNLRDIKMDNKTYLSVRFGNKEDAEYIGGLNIFGRAFGDYEQDIVMIIEYK